MSDLSNENIIHVKKENVEYIQFRRLLEYPEIKHCYTLRKHGINIKKEEDNDQILQESYQKIGNALGWNKEDILKPHQTHTDIVEKVINSAQVLEEVDGVITNQKNITLCTTSADCTSLLFYDPVKKVIADTHSGWRGTLQKIGQKTVTKMIKEYGSNPIDIICCICPCIQKCHFEVEEDVMNLFSEQFHDIIAKDQIIEKGKIKNGKQKYQIDTTKINQYLLKQIGLKEENIINSNLCTVCHAEEFHSYRVDKEKSGRNAAMISII